VLGWILISYRKTVHVPIDYLLSLFSLRIPAPATDVLLVYLAIGGILFRTLSYEEPSPLKAQFPVTWRSRFWDFRMRAGAVVAAVFWPYFVGGIVRHPCYLIRSSLGYHGRMPSPRRDLSPTERDEAIKTMLSFLDKGSIICTERQLLAAYAMGLAAAVVGLVILNGAVDRLTEGY
jgi:hypothetical protein